jgi:hypothetical protein
MESHMSKKLLLSSALLMGLVSYNAWSQESAAGATAFCANPIKNICTDTAPQRLARKNHIDGLKAEIAQEAALKSEPRIEEMKKKVSKLRFLKRMIETYKIRNQEIMKAAKKKVIGIESVVTDKENVTLLKQYMNEAIDQSAFDQTTRANFKSTIDSIVIGNFADFIEKSNLEDNFLAQMLSNACGSDGLVSNAFATTLNGERYVLICPGFLITLTQTPDLRERFNSILHAISHEMGHHIDNSQVKAGTYNAFLGCIADNYASGFEKTSKDAKFCKKNDEAACNTQVTNSHGGELVADAWGIKVLELHAKKQNYTALETEQLLTNSWSNLCGSQDEGIHPSGNFRMGTLLRKAPGISELLSCDNSTINKKPACTLEGEVNI